MSNPVENSTNGPPAQVSAQCPAGAGKAIKFIQEVQDRFQSSEPERYDRFLQVFTKVYGNFGDRNQEIPSDEEAAPLIHEKMKEIFKDHGDLLEGFESFLPQAAGGGGDAKAAGS